jgi:hypothetical protein
MTPAMQQAAAWIAQSCTGPGGVFRVRPGGSYVSGYFGNITALGLAAAGARPDLVGQWMQWYFDHAHGSGSGVDGVADDGHLDRAGRFVSRGRPDSTDAYGATFLMLARVAYRSGDPELIALIAAHRAELGTIAASVLATQQPGGLTWSRPQHPFAYAIDNEQVYRGLLDGADLMERAYGDAARASAMRAAAARVLAGIQASLWDPQTLTYRPVVNRLGYGAPADLGRAYPDALAQVMAILYGVVPPSSPLALSLLARTQPTLSAAPNGDAAEYRLVLAIARAFTTKAAPAGVPFVPPPICADAGWFLQLQSGWTP